MSDKEEMDVDEENPPGEENDEVVEVEEDEEEEEEEEEEEDEEAYDDEQQPPNADEDEEPSTPSRSRMSLPNKTNSNDDLWNKGIRTNPVTTIFWKHAWPVLAENGWHKIVRPPSADRPAGSVLLAPSSDVDIENGKEGVDYYSRIKDVIDRINERRNVAESTAADHYRRAIAKPMNVYSPSFLPSFTRPRRNKKSDLSPKSQLAEEIDLSWKRGSKNFPRKISQVGDDYQVPAIPEVGTDDRKSSDTYCELVWDPKRAEEKGIFREPGKDVLSQVKYNIREQAMLMLAKLDYDVEKFAAKKDQLKPIDGSDWSQEKKNRFHEEVFRWRRDLRKVSKIIDEPIQSCHAYYLGTYKTTAEYRLLKTVCIEERERKEEITGPTDVCAICDDGGSLLICDGCEGEYHMKCVRPALAAVPEGRWECDECVNRKVLEARDYLIRHTKLFESVPANRKRPLDQPDDQAKPGAGDESSPEVVFKPVETVLEAVRKMSRRLNEVLSTPEENKDILSSSENVVPVEG